MNITSGLLSQIKSSLANSAHGWKVYAYVPTYVAGATDLDRVTVSLRTMKLKIAVGSVVSLQIAYIARYSAGSYQDGQVFLNGVGFRTTDSTLHTQIMALGQAFAAAQAAALEASIAAGPQA